MPKKNKTGGYIATISIIFDGHNIELKMWNLAKELDAKAVMGKYVEVFGCSLKVPIGRPYLSSEFNSVVEFYDSGRYPQTEKKNVNWVCLMQQS